MSDFCGFIGKAGKEELYSVINAVKGAKNVEPVCLGDGSVHMAFAPYTELEENQIGHNADFTVWAMMDMAGMEENVTAETIIACYEKKGLSFVGELDGTFSVVIWDGILKKLYLIRDRFGAKPLFYAKTEDGIIFSTKIKGILQYSKYEKKMNVVAVYQYMSFQSVFLPHTVFEGIYHVSAGTYGIYASGKYEEVYYGDMLFDRVSDDCYEKAADKLEMLLRKSVNQCTKADDLGIFLSGGLDSGLVSALADRGKIKKSFCLRPVTGENSIHRKESDVECSSYLAKKYGIEQNVWEMTAKELAEEAHNIIECFAQPFAGTMSTYFLAKKMAGCCRNILTGDGADELFGSYRHHSILLPMQRYVAYRENGISVVGKEDKFTPYGSSVSFLESLYQYAGNQPTFWYYKLLQMGDEEKALFLNQDVFGEYVSTKHTLREIMRWEGGLKSTGVLNRALERDFKHLLPGHTMLYQETLAKSFGIRLIMPFMNSNLVNYVVTLPQEYKIRRGQTKAVLKEVGKRVLPQEIVVRRKEPFSLPVTEWLKTELKEYLTDVLCMASVKRHGLLNSDCVQYALNEFYKHPSTKEYYGQMLWTMAMLEEWAELYM